MKLSDTYVFGDEATRLRSEELIYLALQDRIRQALRGLNSDDVLLIR